MAVKSQKFKSRITGSKASNAASAWGNAAFFMINGATYEKAYLSRQKSQEFL
jgi:hypothetical protein